MPAHLVGPKADGAGAWACAGTAGTHSKRPTAARVGPAASADLTGPASAAPQARAHAAVDSGTSLSEQASPRPVFPRSDACWTSRLGAVNVGGATRSLVLLLYVPRFVFLRQIPSPETRRFFIGPDLLGSLMPPRVRRGSPWVDGRFLWFMYEFALPDGIKCYVRTSFFLDCGFEFPRARDDDDDDDDDGGGGGGGGDRQTESPPEGD